MDAKELYDHYKDRCARSPREMEDDEFALVIRALSLLAAVEDGEGIVRNLDTLRDFLDMAGQDTYSEIATQAAARITLDAQEKAALKAELASVKAHAEARIAQARNDALESAAKWHEERAAELQKDKLEYMVKDMRACLGNCLLFIDAHVVCATAIRELKCSAAHPKE